jgi:predicted CoA-binding protein
MAEPTLDDVRRILERSRTVAVLGAHWEPSRPACYVPQYLFDHGYRVLPINPAGVGRNQDQFGNPFVASLADITEPVDVVDVFRRSELVAGHTDEILAMSPLPKVVWLQLGIRDDAFATRLRAAGIEVVQDRCMLADHRRMLGS